MSTRNFVRGNALVGILVGAGIMGILAVVFSKTMSTQLKTITFLEDRTEREDARNYLRLRMDCQQTIVRNNINNVACGSDYIPLYSMDTSAGPFLSAPVHTLGIVKLRARCSGTTIKTFTVEIKQSGDWRNLFPNIPLSCDDDPST